MLQEIFSVTFFVAFATAAIRMAIPLMYAGLGETFLERAGILNIGLEAVMLNGAFAGFALTFLTGNLLLGLLGGMAGGVMAALLHAFFSVKLAKDQSVCGIAMNMFILGLTSFLFKLMVQGHHLPNIPTLDPIRLPLLGDIPVLGAILFRQDILVYCAFLIFPAASFLLNRTTWGLSLSAIGEHPRAADTVGVNVHRMQYGAAVISGALGGLGGAYLTLVQIGVFSENVTSGRGYIALATVILGGYQPGKVFAGALLFGAADALQVRLQAIGVPIPSQALTMLPYIITILALLATAGKSNEPESLSKPYLRSMR